MKFEEINKILKGIPFISEHNARRLYYFILENNITSILELGIAHGVASCYMAAAIEELGGGKVVSVDLEEAFFHPSAEELIESCNFGNIINIYREKTGYNWFLHNEIKKYSNNSEKVCEPQYDLCIIDGPKNWTIDSSAFYLPDKLLKKDGWIVFDDYNWTYAGADKKRESTDGITHRKLSNEERDLPHIKELFELCVMQHPDYGNFEIQVEGDWAWAQKNKSETKYVKYTSSVTFKAILVYLLDKIKKTLHI